mmetsp:Transcript_72808/g.208996  ORF Transcript_72808/g.208996 Transcript_72808/m.208996 type:complete len:233 (+) Transcript_72808:464-1162(+)
MLRGVGRQRRGGGARGGGLARGALRGAAAWPGRGGRGAGARDRGPRTAHALPGLQQGHLAGACRARAEGPRSARGGGELGRRGSFVGGRQRHLAGPRRLQGRLLEAAGSGPGAERHRFLLPWPFGEQVPAPAEEGPPRLQDKMQHDDPAVKPQQPPVVRKLLRRGPPRAAQPRGRPQRRQHRQPLRGQPGGHARDGPHLSMEEGDECEGRPQRVRRLRPLSLRNSGATALHG